MKSSTMRMLTVRRPWVDAIVHCGKDIENRSFGTDYRGDVALIAGRAWAGDEALRAVNRIAGRRLTVAEAVTPGAVVAVVRLAAVHESSDCGGACSPWAMPAVRFHWELSDVRPLERLWPMYGSLGLVWASADDEREILARVA